MTFEVLYIELFEPIELELHVLGCQTFPFNLQSESFILRIAGPNNFAFLVGGDVQEPVLKQPLDAPENILNLQGCNLCDVKFLGHDVVVLFGYCVGCD